jgi:hypothetical protein
MGTWTRLARCGQRQEKTPKLVRPRRDFEALKQRRLRAADMFYRGKSRAEVAHALGITRESASNRRVDQRRDGAGVWAVGLPPPTPDARCCST